MYVSEPIKAVAKGEWVVIDLSKVQIVEVPDKFRDDMILFRGGLQMAVEIRASKSESVTKEVIHDHIRGAIWHKCYGDLISPLSELKSIALMSHDFSDAERALKICRQLDALLEKYPHHAQQTP